MKRPSNKTIMLVGGLLLGLVVIYLTATYAIPQMLVTFSKAAPATTVSVGNSYVIGQKILAKANGKDKCVVNVFVMDASGKGVMGKAVELSGTGNIVPLATKTDSSGKVGFEITSEKEGQFELTASIGGVELPKTIKVTFRNQE